MIQGARSFRSTSDTGASSSVGEGVEGLEAGALEASRDGTEIDTALGHFGTNLMGVKYHEILKVSDRLVN